METVSCNLAPARGLLNQRMSMEHFDLIRIMPSRALTPFVENYWIILWDLAGKPDYVQENMPHPSVNMVIDPNGQTGIFGIHSGKFSYRLSGTGRIFGVKFWPGAFYSFWPKSISGLRNTHIPISDIFDVDDVELERKFVGYNDPLDMAKEVESLLLEKYPHLDDKAVEAGRLTELVCAQPEITKVDQLCSLSGISIRALQRLFETYVGAGPKWVIDRYRILAAVDALNKGDQISLTELAHGLGYFDQAHFVRAFCSLTGNSPSFYLGK